MTSTTSLAEFIITIIIIVVVVIEIICDKVHQSLLAGEAHDTPYIAKTLMHYRQQFSTAAVFCTVVSTKVKARKSLVKRINSQLL